MRHASSKWEDRTDDAMELVDQTAEQLREELQKLRLTIAEARRQRDQGKKNA